MLFKFECIRYEKRRILFQRVKDNGYENKANLADDKTQTMYGALKMQ
jgi:hypothetical protein